MTVFQYIRHYETVILLLCITTSETGLQENIIVERQEMAHSSGLEEKLYHIRQ